MTIELVTTDGIFALDGGECLPLLAIDAGAMTVEINPSETPLTQWMSYSIRGYAGKVLPALVSAAWPQIDLIV